MDIGSAFVDNFIKFSFLADDIESVDRNLGCGQISMYPKCDYTVVTPYWTFGTLSKGPLS